ncbi:nucleoside ABC transporter membrane protein [Dethiosulfatibacter aminovorans DSM 17477]|uniref:Nucleoside ABC transporter membrane protein n=1 Tax=Dethiosulfatibacter aminovorans DSM 17477 TaxID=1121476 RepID=A0A1M6FQ05_9FIRM|nr:ABC transporter permease [Dethiosulfatibacter aminovorans]SHI99777.1 nucleoside ABC transporter membrane protein [Dethiosulfatibacter aminovorans DSM 17477]
MSNGFFTAMIIAGIPLLFATLGELITEKAGNLNLGVEGMMLIGAVAGFGMGMSTASPLMTIIGAGMAGALAALVYAFLTVTLRANQVVSGLSLTIFGTGFSSFLGTNYIGQRMPREIISFFKPVSIPILSRIPIVGPALFAQDPYVYLGLVCSIVTGFYLYRTRPGLYLRAVGENPSAADAAGINVSLYKYIHILTGGALCGLGGAYLSVVSVPTWQDNITAGRGWIAVALVIFARWNPYRAIFGAVLFGGLSILGFRIQHLNIPQSLLNMLPYLVTIIVLAFSSAKKSKLNSPPKGLSIPYFREER